MIRGWKKNKSNDSKNMKTRKKKINCLRYIKTKAIDSED